MMHERNMLGELLTIKGSERHAMVQSGTYSPPAQTAEEEAAGTAEIHLGLCKLADRIRPRHGLQVPQAVWDQAWESFSGVLSSPRSLSLRAQSI